MDRASYCRSSTGSGHHHRCESYCSYRRKNQTGLSSTTRTTKPTGRMLPTRGHTRRIVRQTASASNSRTQLMGSRPQTSSSGGNAGQNGVPSKQERPQMTSTSSVMNPQRFTGAAHPNDYRPRPNKRPLVARTGAAEPGWTHESERSRQSKYVYAPHETENLLL